MSIFNIGNNSSSSLSRIGAHRNPPGIRKAGGLNSFGPRIIVQNRTQNPTRLTEDRVDTLISEHLQKQGWHESEHGKIYDACNGDFSAKNVRQVLSSHAPGGASLLDTWLFTPIKTKTNAFLTRHPYMQGALNVASAAKYAVWDLATQKVVWPIASARPVRWVVNQGFKLTDTMWGWFWPYKALKTVIQTSLYALGALTFYGVCIKAWSIINSFNFFPFTMIQWPIQWLIDSVSDQTKKKALKTLQLFIDKVVIPTIKSTVKAVVETITEGATHALNYIGEQVVWIAEKPTEALIAAVGYTAKAATWFINVGVRAGLRAGYEFVTTSDWETLATATAALAATGLYFKILSDLATRQRKPQLATEFHQVDWTSQTVDTLYKYTFGLFQKDPPKPIFDETLQKSMDEIRKSIKNVHKNGKPFIPLLLKGPPGTGKTMVAKQIARECGYNFVSTTGADLMDAVKDGTAIPKLQQMLAFGRNTKYPTIVYFDEMEPFALKKSLLEKVENAQTRLDLQAIFKAATGEPSNKLMIMGTTNFEKDMDSTILDRFQDRIYVPVPGWAARVKIINQYLDRYLPRFGTPERKKGGSLDQRAIDEIASMTSGLSGRALQALVNKLDGVRSAQKNNRLTAELIHQTVERYVEQERCKPGTESTMLDRIRDIWHFTLPRIALAIRSILKSVFKDVSPTAIVTGSTKQPAAGKKVVPPPKKK